MALHLKNNNLKHIVICFLGDGAVNQGAFHESLNMAGLWKLPIVFICENNLYSMSTPLDKGMANPDIAAKGEMYKLHSFTGDGNNIEEVISITKNAKTLALDFKPSLIEFKTYRFSGHSRGDQRIYRTRDEEALWKENDPILQYKTKLLKENILTSENDKKIIDTVKHNITEAVEFSENSSYPSITHIQQGVYTQ
jgi:TPP-dependent pyruvate/acetoin dehydrogenase alpha subunit